MNSPGIGYLSGFKLDLKLLVMSRPPRVGEQWRSPDGNFVRVSKTSPVGTMLVITGEILGAAWSKHVRNRTMTSWLVET